MASIASIEKSEDVQIATVQKEVNESSYHNPDIHSSKEKS
jgi:hypothetical protein